MNWGLFVLYIVLASEFGFVVAKHGKPKETEYCWWASLISIIFLLLLVWWACGWKFI